MRLQVEEKDRYSLIIVEEERLDFLTAPFIKDEFLALLENSGKKNHVLNISNCTFCDAAGLNMFNLLNNLHNAAELKLIITGIHTNVDNMMKVCMLDSVLNIANSLDEVESFLISEN